MPLFSSAADFSALARSLSVPVDIQKKAEGVLETLQSELDQQDGIEVCFGLRLLRLMIIIGT